MSSNAILFSPVHKFIAQAEEGIMMGDLSYVSIFILMIVCVVSCLLFSVRGLLGIACAKMDEETLPIWNSQAEAHVHPSYASMQQPESSAQFHPSPFHRATSEGQPAWHPHLGVAQRRHERRIDRAHEGAPEQP